MVPIADGIARAVEAGLDLVEIAPNSEPPVCKILDYGKYKYQAQKKAAEARKKQRTVEIKEIKMRPNIDIHDYEVKMRSIVRFFEEGDKVKVTLRFRGREMAHMELGTRLLERVKHDTLELAKVEFGAEARGPANGDGAGAALGDLTRRLGGDVADMALGLGVGSAKEEALAGFAAELEQLGHDLLGLHAFGRDLQAEGVRQADHGLDDLAFLGLVQHLADERPVDLDRVRAEGREDDRGRRSRCRNRRARS